MFFAEAIQAEGVSYFVSNNERAFEALVSDKDASPVQGAHAFHGGVTFCCAEMGTVGLKMFQKAWNLLDKGVPFIRPGVVIGKDGRPCRRIQYPLSTKL